MKAHQSVDSVCLSVHHMWLSFIVHMCAQGVLQGFQVSHLEYGKFILIVRFCCHNIIRQLITLLKQDGRNHVKRP